MLSELASPPPHFGDPPSLRRRAASLALALAITLLILLGFLGLNSGFSKRPDFAGGAFTLHLDPNAEEKADAPKHVDTKAQARPSPAAARLPPPPIPLVKPPPTAREAPEYILLTKEEYEKYDFGKPDRPADTPGTQQGTASAGSSAGDARPIGTAPNGEPLYAAQWYRRPTDTELGMYLPRNTPVIGSGMIACRTVARYHVDDCVELGSAPPGSHLAGAVRQAAWQFLVRPPRLGGKEMVGTWVRIRIDYGVTLRDREPERQAAPAEQGPGLADRQ